MKPILKSREDYVAHHASQLEDIYAMSFIQPLLSAGSFLPFTNGTLKPVDLICILSDVAINRPRKILEFGSGISSILLGRLITQIDLACEVYTVEHDKDWMSYTERYLRKDKTADIVKLIHAPLSTSQFALEGNEWYSSKILEEQGITNMKFDMVVVDGPPAYEKKKNKARYPAFSFVKEMLSENSIFYLDDANRKGELAVIRRWQKEHEIAFTHSKGNLAYYSKGKRYNPILFK